MIQRHVCLHNKGFRRIVYTMSSDLYPITGIFSNTSTKRQLLKQDWADFIYWTHSCVIICQDFDTTRYLRCFYYRKLSRRKQPSLKSTQHWQTVDKLWYSLSMFGILFTAGIHYLLGYLWKLSGCDGSGNGSRLWLSAIAAMLYFFHSDWRQINQHYHFYNGSSGTQNTSESPVMCCNFLQWPWVLVLQ